MTATISDDGRYRYNLTRLVSPTVEQRLDGDTRSRVLWIMLNPSTADANKDDPTIRKCRGFTERLGGKEFEVVNLFAYRATRPGALWQADKDGIDIIGPDNGRHIQEAVERSEMVIAAWGSHVNGKALARARVQRVRETVEDLFHLSLSKHGHPRHPLMLGYKHQPTRWAA